jgi:hypothetical protein
MEIEDLKIAMEEEQRRCETNRSVDDLDRALRTRARTFRRGMVRRFLLELAGAGLIYLLVLGLVILSGRPLAAFHVKLLVVSVLGFAALTTAFARFFLLTRSGIMGLPAREHLVCMLRRQKRLVRFYSLWVYVCTLIFAVVFWGDQSFRSLSSAWKAGTTLYLLVVGLMTRPYLHLIYGRQLRAIEEQLRSWDSESAI